VAYKVSLLQNCKHSECGGVATYQVFNHRNALMGYFCHKHADEEVEKLNPFEAKSGKLL